MVWCRLAVGGSGESVLATAVMHLSVSVMPVRMRMECRAGESAKSGMRMESSARVSAESGMTMESSARVSVESGAWVEAESRTRMGIRPRIVVGVQPAMARMMPMRLAPSLGVVVGRGSVRVKVMHVVEAHDEGCLN